VVVVVVAMVFVIRLDACRPSHASVACQKQQ